MCVCTLFIICRIATSDDILRLDFFLLVLTQSSTRIFFQPERLFGPLSNMIHGSLGILYMGKLHWNRQEQYG